MSAYGEMSVWYQRYSVWGQNASDIAQLNLKVFLTGIIKKKKQTPKLSKLIRRQDIGIMLNSPYIIYYEFVSALTNSHAIAVSEVLATGLCCRWPAGQKRPETAAGNESICSLVLHVGGATLI